MGPSGDEGGRAPGPEATGDPARRRLWVSHTPGRVVVHYLDGRILKGYTDLDPARPTFHLLPADASAGEAVEVVMADLKAVFFVRNFTGDPAYVESDDLYGPRPPGTRKVRVEFEDGEELVGFSRENPAGRPGFFFTPLDRRSNNLRVFAVTGAVRRVDRRL